MNWEQLIEGFKVFWEQPVPIIGFTVGTVIIGIITIISKTSFGKKKLLQLQTTITSLTTAYDNYKSKTDEKVAELEAYYKEKLALIETKKSNTEQLLLDIASQIHNVNIDKMVQEYKAKMNKDIVIGDIVDNKLSDIKTEYENAKQELLKAKEEYEALINGYQESKKEI